jgi:hypothetical protein
MTARAAQAGVVTLLVLATFGIGAVLIGRELSGPSMNGLLIGAGLGGLNLLVEAFALLWALAKRPTATLKLSLGGFFFRLVLVSVLIVVFHGVESVDAVTFGLTYVASFFLFLGLQIWIISRVLARSGSSKKGASEGA